MSRTWQDNAAEFGTLTKQGRDFRLTLLVACSVERAGMGGDRGNQYTGGKSQLRSAKVNATVFANQAGTSADRVLRHLDAWNRLAADGLVDPSSELTPDDVAGEWSSEVIEAFEAKGALGTTARESVKGLANTVGDLLAEDDEFREKVLARKGATTAVLSSIEPDEFLDGLHDEEAAEVVATLMGKPDVADVVASGDHGTTVINSIVEAEARQPERKAQRRERKEREASGDTVKVFRVRAALAAMLSLSALADELDTSAYLRDPEGMEAASQVGSALDHLSRQFTAWAEGRSTRLDLDDELRRLLEDKA